MVLDRDELAARLAVADLSNPKFPNDLRDRAWVNGWADDVVHAADALLSRLRPAAPVAPDATDPRRTVGAVVRWASGGVEFIVVKAGEGEDVQRELDGPLQKCVFSHSSDVFVRWATRAECERHGIPFVDRTPAAGLPPAEAPVSEVNEADEGHAAWAAHREATSSGGEVAVGQWLGYSAGWLARARAAAPTATRSVDREELAKALRTAWYAAPGGGDPWTPVADAAIAYFAARGGA